MGLTEWLGPLRGTSGQGTGLFPQVPLTRGNTPASTFRNPGLLWENMPPPLGAASE